jgi:tetratricopeptide (TPR) repeat protein
MGGGPKFSPRWVFLLLLVVACVVYFPALGGEFLWDDAGHVTRPDLRSLAGLGRIWFEIGATQQYYPILHSAFWLEHAIWGDATFGYHFINVVLHATAAFFFGLILRRLAVPGAWFAALLFALHPVCVESVAWISEQKNTLSAVFYLGAALVYLRFDADRRSKHYAWASVLFVLALLTKTVTATLPAALLVIFWWRRGRLDAKRDVAPLLPWFAASAAMGMLTAHFEHELIGARGADFALSFVERGLLAGRVFWFYLSKLLWPVDLAFIYPRWSIDSAMGWQWLFLFAALAAFGGLAWWSRRQRGPLAVALLFAGTLFPVLGFFNVYPFVFSYVADHFQYLASLSLFALAGAGLTRAFATQAAPLRVGLAVVLLTILGGLTWRQSGMYQDLFTLYETTLRQNPNAWMAHHNLAFTLANAGRVTEAIPHVETVIKLKPDYAPAENNLGDYLLQLERPADAIPHLQRALQLQPEYPVAERNLGMALATLNRTAEALPHFEAAIRLDPNYADAELNLGIGLMLTKRFPEAVPHFERAIKLNPDSAHFHDTYGRALANVGRFTEAVAQHRQAVELDPDSSEAHMNLALALRQLGRASEAEAQYREAMRLKQ